MILGQSGDQPQVTIILIQLFSLAGLTVSFLQAVIKHPQRNERNSLLSVLGWMWMFLIFDPPFYFFLIVFLSSHLVRKHPHNVILTLLLLSGTECIYLMISLLFMLLFPSPDCPVDYYNTRGGGSQVVFRNYKNQYMAYLKKLKAFLRVSCTYLSDYCL